MNQLTARPSRPRGCSTSAPRRNCRRRPAMRSPNGRWSSSRRSSTTRSMPARRPASRPRSRSASTTTGITIADNGPGLPAKTVKSILDFSSRTSSREAYVAPTRGAQGNALKTIVAMPFVLSGGELRRRRDRGARASGTASSSPSTRSGRRRRSAIAVEPSDRKKGTEIKVRWPDLACSILDQCQDAFFTNRRRLRLAQPAPDADRRLVRRRSRATAATAPGWTKWKPSDPTSPHWYTPERFAAADRRLCGS